MSRSPLSHAERGGDPSGLNPNSVQINISERDVLKAILEFLEGRGLHITQLSLERETGVINGDYSDDLLFLRQLIIDGQWDNAVDFVEPLKNVENFDHRSFRYNITKYKFFELLCIKLEPGPMHDNDFAVEELVECLKDLEHIAPSPEDYRQLCALLTLPRLSDHADFRYWNPSSARIECFNKVRPLVDPILPPTVTHYTQSTSSIHDRLVALLTKGVFYEACVDYCQGQAVGDPKTREHGPVPGSVLCSRPRISATDLSLISWLEIVSREQFAMPFQQKSLEMKVESLKKPKLEAQWTEQILATPIKPGGAFPHGMVPPGKAGCHKFTSKMMSQSMTALPLSHSFNNNIFPTTTRIHPMSHSTAPSIGFSIASGTADGGDTIMQQSAMIEQLLESSEHTKSSRPTQAAASQPQQQPWTSVAPQVFSPGMVHSMTGSMAPGQPFAMNGDLSHARRQLDEMTRRSLPAPSSQRQSSLPPVPELSTPGQDGDSLMTQSRLFQEFANRQTRFPNQPQAPQLPPPGMPIYPQIATHAAPAAYAPIPQQMEFPIQYHNNGQPMSGQTPPPRPVSMNLQQHQQAPPLQIRPISCLPQSTSGLPVQFVPVCRYEDSQAIRAVSFHPTGRFFAIGTNSKQMHICRYPDVKRFRNSENPQTPELLLSRPKQHRGSVYCLGFNPTGELLATGSNDKSLRIMAFNAEACKIGAEMELSVHDGTVRDVVFLEDSANRTSALVSGGAGNCLIHVTDCNTGQTFQNLRGHTAPILGLYTWASGAGNQFVSCSQDKTIRFWDVRSSQATKVITPNSKSSSAPVTSICIDPSGQLLVSGHEDASVALYHIGGSRILQTFRPHGDEVRSVRFSNAAYYLLSASYDKRVVITDMRGDLVAPLMYLPVAEHSDKVIQCRWHPYDFSFLSTSADRTAVLWALPVPPTYQ